MSEPVPAPVELDPTVTFDEAGPVATVGLGLVVNAGIDLPGLRLAVERTRCALVLQLGVIDGTFGFRVPEPTLELPSSMAAELDIPGFRGGGRLQGPADPTRSGQWQGALAAQLGPVAVSGLGVLDLEQRSLLVLLAAEFTPPIQLSFGFTLAGIGGIVGINRRPDPPALTAAAASGELGRLLFPRDPVAQAGQLLGSLDRCFPLAPGEFVVGPMVKLGWGTPTLVTAAVAVLAGDAGMLVLGRVALKLPSEDLALIRIEALVKATVDANGLALDAVLSNSVIAGVPIDGEMRLRARGGNNPVFALAIGGFHPSFAPPDGMAGMRRVTASISPGALLRARLSAYAALTTSSVQFGARVEIEAGIAGFGIKGHFNFDALVTLEPFGFMVDFRARVAVECASFDVCSISLRGHLSGPAPWRIRGHASISILFWDVDIDIPEITWGESATQALPPAPDPAAVLVDQLGIPSNWSATSRSVPHLVQLRPGVDGDHSAVHPLAELGFRQSAVPLDTELRRMDSRPLGVPVTLGVKSGAVGGQLTKTSEHFVPTQFLELDDHAKLASAGYVSLCGGFDLEPGGSQTGNGTVVEADYETVALSREDKRSRVWRLTRSNLSDLDTPSRLTARHGTVTPALRPALVTIRDPGAGVIAATNDLSDRNGDLVTKLTAAAGRTGDGALAATAAALGNRLLDGTGLAGVEADVHLARLAAVDRDAASGLQVVRAWELAR
jgi:hypothetical protein